jgi:hypothetical protein
MLKERADGFYNWGQKKLGKSRTQIETWTGLARAGKDKPFKNLEDFVRTPKQHGI